MQPGQGTLQTDATGRIWDRLTGLEQIIPHEVVRQALGETGVSFMPEGLEKPVDVMAVADLLSDSVFGTFRGKTLRRSRASCPFSPSWLPVKFW
jgi:hypothetical protein